MARLPLHSRNLHTQTATHTPPHAPNQEQPADPQHVPSARDTHLQRHGHGGRLSRLLLLRGRALRAPRAHLLAQARAEGRRVGRRAVAPALLLRLARVLAAPAVSQVTLALQVGRAAAHQLPPGSAGFDLQPWLIQAGSPSRS